MLLHHRALVSTDGQWSYNIVYLHHEVIFIPQYYITWKNGGNLMLGTLNKQ